MADAGAGSPPAKSKAKGQSAAAAADASSPAASDIRTGTVNVPGSGTLTVSQDTPGVAKDENGRTVRLAKHLADYALSSPTGSGADAEHPALTGPGSAIDLDLQPELQCHHSIFSRRHSFGSRQWSLCCVPNLFGDLRRQSLGRDRVGTQFVALSSRCQRAG